MGEGPLSETARRGARTRPGEHGQFVGSSSLLGHTLPEGTRIGGLEIVGLVGEGGFGIVYLAYDESLQRDVAVKEYMPSSLAARASGSFDVTVRAERYRETFEAGLKSFVNEARLLAKFDHASLLKVYRFWEANGTAYMAMPFYEGMTLKATLAAMREPPGEARLREWLTPILDALEVMHEAHCFHRDIAPDNILLTRHGPVLLDFGAARRVIGDMTHALTVVLKPGYAPIEQYGDTPMQQGAWTDLYALGCVVYYAVSGRTPPSSVERMMSGDSLEPLQRIGAGRYSDGFLRAIDAALALHPKDRPQTVARFRALLDAAGPVPRIDALVPARQVGAEGKVERLIHRELRDEPDTGGELITDFAKDIDAAKAELVGKRSRSPTTVVYREQAAIEVDVDGLEPGQQSAQKAGAVSVLSHRSWQIQCQTRSRRLGVAEPARNSERAGAVSFTSEAEGVRIPQHVVGSSKVEAGPEPRRDGRRDVDTGLHRPLALEPGVVGQ